MDWLRPRHRQRPTSDVQEHANIFLGQFQIARQEDVQGLHDPVVQAVVAMQLGQPAIFGPVRQAPYPPLQLLQLGQLIPLSVQGFGRLQLAGPVDRGDGVADASHTRPGSGQAAPIVRRVRPGVGVVLEHHQGLGEALLVDQGPPEPPRLFRAQSAQAVEFESHGDERRPIALLPGEVLGGHEPIVVPPEQTGVGVRGRTTGLRQMPLKSRNKRASVDHRPAAPLPRLYLPSR